MVNRFNSEIDFVEVERLDKEGKSAREIAEIVGCSTRTISRWRRANGRSQAKNRIDRTADRERARILIFEDGVSMQEAARTVGVYPAQVGKWFPDAPRMSRQQRGEMAALARRANEILGRP